MKRENPVLLQPTQSLHGLNHLLSPLIFLVEPIGLINRGHALIRESNNVVVLEYGALSFWWLDGTDGAHRLLIADAIRK